MNIWCSKCLFRHCESSRFRLKLQKLEPNDWLCFKKTSHVDDVGCQSDAAKQLFDIMLKTIDACYVRALDKRENLIIICLISCRNHML